MGLWRKHLSRFHFYCSFILVSHFIIVHKWDCQGKDNQFTWKGLGRQTSLCPCIVSFLYYPFGICFVGDFHFAFLLLQSLSFVLLSLCHIPFSFPFSKSIMQPWETWHDMVKSPVQFAHHQSPLQGHHWGKLRKIIYISTTKWILQAFQPVWDWYQIDLCVYTVPINHFSNIILVPLSCPFCNTCRRKPHFQCHSIRRLRNCNGDFNWTDNDARMVV